MRHVARRWRGWVVLLGSLMLVASCATTGGSKRVAGGVEINDVDMGRTADSVNISITDVTHDFRPDDRVFVTVKYHNTTNDNVTLGLKWYKDNAVVGEDGGTLLPGEHASLFHLQSQSPLAMGDYKLEVSVNGTLLETKKFEVKGA
jgi:hypothetical protein